MSRIDDFKFISVTENYVDSIFHKKTKKLVDKYYVEMKSLTEWDSGSLPDAGKILLKKEIKKQKIKKIKEILK